jgi:hypothetical protein
VDVQAFPSAKIFCIWLAFWSIRRRAGVDYKLSLQGQAVRWAAVAACFALTSVAGENLGWFRVSVGFLGFWVVCLANLAYYLNSMFEAWPVAEGRVNSVRQESAANLRVTYDFEVGGERYGGEDRMKADSRPDSSCSPREGTPISISYDPLNPGRSSRIGKQPSDAKA